MGRPLALIDESGNTCKVIVQDVKIMYPVDKLIKCFPDDKTFQHAAKYHAHLKHLEDMCCSMNENILPDI